MNIITHSVAYCLFPRLTIVERLSRTFSGSPVVASRNMMAHQKYVDRGFAFVTTSPGDPTHGSVERWVGDRYTWAAPLSPSLSHLPPDLMALNAFQLVFDQSTGGSIEYDLVNSPKLRFEYTSSVEERSALCAAWDVQASKPRSSYAEGRSVYSYTHNYTVFVLTLLSVNSLIRPVDLAFCDAMYVIRNAIARGDIVSSSFADGWNSTLHFTNAGRTRIL